MNSRERVLVALDHGEPDRVPIDFGGLVSSLHHQAALGVFEVEDLGCDVAPEKFVEAVRQKTPHILGMSALMTTTMTAMRDTIDALTDANLRGRVKVMVGGAPLTQAYCDEIGADAYAPDAWAAVKLAKELLDA